MEPKEIVILIAEDEPVVRNLVRLMLCAERHDARGRVEGVVSLLLARDAFPNRQRCFRRVDGKPVVQKLVDLITERTARRRQKCGVASSGSGPYTGWSNYIRLQHGGVVISRGRC
jgi:hypothetical protein